MTLYNQFIQTIKAIQDKNLIVYNLLKGQKYSSFTVGKIDDNSLYIKFNEVISVIPDFEEHHIFLPYLNDRNMHSYSNEYFELLCDIQEIDPNHIIINIEKSLQKIQKNKLNFQSNKTLLPKISFSKTQNKLNFSNQYYIICNHIKEITKQNNNNQHAFIVNFNFRLSTFNLKFVEPKQFDNFEFLFFIDDKNIIKEYSNLVFQKQGKSTDIDIKKTILKIELFNSMKNF